VYEQYYACNNCINRRVSIHTASGAFHEGVIVNVDHQNVYLDTSIAVAAAGVSSKKTKGKGKAKTSAFGFGGRQTILTLALFDLLAIALLV
jgi:small nuclear ribonucleoprotein (snRNP)-like protein